MVDVHWYRRWVTRGGDWGAFYYPLHGDAVCTTCLHMPLQDHRGADPFTLLVWAPVLNNSTPADATCMAQSSTCHGLVRHSV